MNTNETDAPGDSGRPWRDRPDSFARGYVAGSMAGGWLCAVLMAVLLAATRDIGWLWVGIPFVLLAAFGTFMWRHG